MNGVVLRCCSGESKFRVTYVTGSTYIVCSDCMNLPHWSRGIKSKEEV